MRGTAGVLSALPERRGVTAECIQKGLVIARKFPRNGATALLGTSSEPCALRGLRQAHFAQ
jgi:hypothetical protein